MRYRKGPLASFAFFSASFAFIFTSHYLRNWYKPLPPRVLFLSFRTVHQPLPNRISLESRSPHESGFSADLALKDKPEKVSKTVADISRPHPMAA